MSRTELINHLIKIRNFKSYLEIGIDYEDANFAHIHCAYKVGVDVKPVSTFTGTSDEFFLQNKEPFDLVFIDGLHTEEQVLKDINNALHWLQPNGILLLHDCMPPNAWYQRELHEYRAGEAWNGTVWKAILRIFNSSTYKCSLWDTDWGYGFIDTSQYQEPILRELPDELHYPQHYEWLEEYIADATELTNLYTLPTSIQNQALGVTILLIPYNNMERFKLRLEREVLPTLLAHPTWQFQLIIIDNSDADKKVELQEIQAKNIQTLYLWVGENLMYGPAINLAIQHSVHSYLIYLCSNHGRMYDPTWIDDLLNPMLQNPNVAMTGCLCPSGNPVEMGFPTHLPSLHIQGGIFGARTDILRAYPYSTDHRWVHGGSDVYQSFQLFNIGFFLQDVSTVKSVWSHSVASPERWKYVHDYSE